MPKNKNLSLSMKNQNLSLNDELSQQINRLSNIFKKYINQINLKISKNKAIFSFIEKTTTFIQTIITNIINHNYTFNQLKSLEESINQIKEKNNENKLNLFNEEQNMNIFTEEANILIKSIEQKYKIQLEEWSNYFSLPLSSRIKNNSFKKNLKINKSEYNEENYSKIDNYNYRINSENRRTKSKENQNRILEMNKKLNVCKSQKILFNKTTNNIKNNHNLDGKGIHFINLNLPMNKHNSIYKIDIKNEVLLNKYIKIKPKENQKQIYKSWNNIKEKSEIDINKSYENQIDNLTKKLIYYKNMVTVLSKKRKEENPNYNSNSNIDNQFLIDKLKIKENEIISKDKIIKILYQQINKLKQHSNNKEKIQSEIGIDIDLMNNVKGRVNNKDNYQKYKTEAKIANFIKSQSYNENNEKETNQIYWKFYLFILYKINIYILFFEILN